MISMQLRKNFQSAACIETKESCEGLHKTGIKLQFSLYFSHNQESSCSFFRFDEFQQLQPWYVKLLILLPPDHGVRVCYIRVVFQGKDAFINPFQMNDIWAPNETWVLHNKTHGKAKMSCECCHVLNEPNTFW